jgi:hypothetical protein
MAIAKVYGLHARDQYGTTAASRIDWVTDTIKTALTTSSHTLDQDAHDFFTDLTNEVAGTGYTAGGVTLAGKTLTYDTASDEARLDANDAAWTTATFTARHAHTYKDTGSGATSHLMSYVDFEGNETVTAGTFTIQWASNGVIVSDVS